MKKVYLLAVLTVFTICAYSQQATNTTGGSGQAGSIILDWSVGELTLVNTVQSGALTFTQGLLQGKLVAFSTSGTISNGELSTLPNPTSGNLNLTTGFLEPGQLHLRLFDAGGKLLIERDIVINAFTTQTMNLTPYASDLYLLQAVFTPTNGKPRNRTYKIIRLP